MPTKLAKLWMLAFMVLSSQSYGFSSSDVWMWELDYKESWAPNNWHFWTVVLEKTLESPLDCKEIQSVHPKGNQSWIFTGRTDAEAETPILWPPDAKNWLIWKDPDAGKDWGQEEKGMTEDKMIGWHHWLDRHELEQALTGGWWTGRPGVLQSMGLQRVRHDWATELTDWGNSKTFHFAGWLTWQPENLEPKCYSSRIFQFFKCKFPLCRVHLSEVGRT